MALDRFTTLGVGGPADGLSRLKSDSEIADFMAWWRALPTPERPPVLVLGGGSNLLVRDGGFAGLVLKLENREFAVESTGEGSVRVRVGAGYPWDEFVARTVEAGWAGVECLSGIPGCVGAAPVQNIGAYGQEVCETIREVHGWDMVTGQPFCRTAEQCCFSYRNSSFKEAPGRFLISSVVFELKPGGEPTVRYGDLRGRFGEAPPTLQQVRETVLEVRRSKSMVYDPGDENHRSAGSFFTNPIVAQTQLEAIVAALEDPDSMPRYPMDERKVKLSAAWLIERAGFPRGFRPTPDSRVGLSTRHVLALTNRGGGTARELLGLAEIIRARVQERFGVELVPEPIVVGRDLDQ